MLNCFRILIPTTTISSSSNSKRPLLPLPTPPSWPPILTSRPRVRPRLPRPRAPPNSTRPRFPSFRVATADRRRRRWRRQLAPPPPQRRRQWRRRPPASLTTSSPRSPWSTRARWSETWRWCLRWRGRRARPTCGRSWPGASWESSSRTGRGTARR